MRIFGTVSTIRAGGSTMQADNPNDPRATANEQLRRTLAGLPPLPRGSWVATYRSELLTLGALGGVGVLLWTLGKHEAVPERPERTRGTLDPELVALQGQAENLDKKLTQTMRDQRTAAGPEWREVGRKMADYLLDPAAQLPQVVDIGKDLIRYQPETIGELVFELSALPGDLPARRLRMTMPGHIFDEMIKKNRQVCTLKDQGLIQVFDAAPIIIHAAKNVVSFYNLRFIKHEETRDLLSECGPQIADAIKEGDKKRKAERAAEVAAAAAAAAPKPDPNFGDIPVDPQIAAMTQRIGNQIKAQPARSSYGSAAVTDESILQGKIIMGCRDLVKENLHAPDDAEFPGLLFDAVPRPTFDARGNGTWRAWVKAPNLYGVKLKKWFTCRYDAKKQRVTASF